MSKARRRIVSAKRRSTHAKADLSEHPEALEILAEFIALWWRKKHAPGNQDTVQTSDSAANQEGCSDH